MSTYLPACLPEPVPTPDGLDAPWWEALRRHELRVQRCNACQTWQWGPEWICHKCLSFDVGWSTVAGCGRIFSWERVWHPTFAALSYSVPYIVVLVELPDAGNIRMVGNLLGDRRQEVVIGTEVEAVFEDHEEADPPFTLVHWQTL
ncbi:MAG: OB-fold domain-containing protein [Deltaproteobacteria bacterium]|nr:OB-fold domain-containing protein [Deltaproteobacteria bacterium]